MTQQLEIVTVSEQNIKGLKLLNAAVLPVVYPDRFYKDLLSHHARLALWNADVIGGISWRLEPLTSARLSVGPIRHRLSIMTLAVLATYRRHGAGAALMQQAMDFCSDHDSIDEVLIYVQVNNDDAIRFYERFGLRIVDTVKNYYPRINPPDCYVMKKFLFEQSVTG
eukprot:TRINITY_DN6784_c0_g1_i1.p2 TRINITY_DN6784_c0_g1~~TRINITY_DN6784_c0_g1_i1.p2  ORF type:complete len:167 (+),score=5.81 TRINITY_DN6784_c0_g1_i1:205-705(+)